MRKKYVRSKFSILKVLLIVVLLLYTFSLLAPVLWALLTSLKSYEEYSVLENVTGLPTVKSLADIIANYKEAWQEGYAYAPVDGRMLYFTIPEQILNSLLYALGCMVAATMTPCLTAYMCAKYPCKFSELIYTIVILAMVIPIVGSMPSELELARALGIYDTFWGLWIQRANFLGAYFLVFYAQFKMIPNAYIEAARIDGASEFFTMVRVMLPMAKGTIGTVGLLKFVEFWNEYQAPMVFLPSYPTLGYGMYLFSQRMGSALSSVPMRVSYMVVVIMPILILFIALRNKLMVNVSVGGIKG